MKYTTSELIGPELDAAVAIAEGLEFVPNALDGSSSAGILVVDQSTGLEDVFLPSCSWLHGGPIIERNFISTEPNDDFCDLSRADKSGGGTAWHSWLVHSARPDGVQRSFAAGPTPLVAAMRAFVTAKLGAEVDL